MNLTTTKQQKIENAELHNAASNMFLKGAGRKDVIDFLAQNGVETQAAETMATSAYLAVKDQLKAIVDKQLGEQATGGGSTGILSILIGIVLIAGGTIATMSTDSIFYGAIGVGVITLFQGLFSRGGG